MSVFDLLRTWITGIFSCPLCQHMTYTCITKRITSATTYFLYVLLFLPVDRYSEERLVRYEWTVSNFYHMERPLYKLLQEIAWSVGAFTEMPQHSEALKLPFWALWCILLVLQLSLRRSTTTYRESFEEPPPLKQCSERQGNHLSSDVFLEVLAWLMVARYLLAYLAALGLASKI